MNSLKKVCALILMTGMNFAAIAQDNGQTGNKQLALELQNPVADLISVPLQSSFDMGSSNKFRYTMNIQPVVPIELGSSGWMVVSRTILPIVAGDSLVPGGRNLGGIGDIMQSFFFAPKEPVNGWIIGAGPVLRLPTASQTELGNGRWGAGPTAVVLRQNNAWTYGILANHVWSFAGWGSTSVNSTYLQPFLSYTTDALTTWSVGTESIYDGVAHQWTTPLDASVSQLVQFGNLPVDFSLGARYYAVRPEGAPDWGMKATVTFMFPK